jgi:hypothetical protein
MKQFSFLFIALLVAVFSLAGCSEETVNYNDPDVRLFVKQLKEGTYQTKNSEGVVAVPMFTVDDIPLLLKYSEDMTEIPFFPLPTISSQFGGKARLGECVLWIIEYIRIGHYPSLGCKLVKDEADSYEGIYFLSNEEVLDAASHYRAWWENVQTSLPSPLLSAWEKDPLTGTDYRWW